MPKRGVLPAAEAEANGAEAEEAGETAEAAKEARAPQETKPLRSQMLLASAAPKRAMSSQAVGPPTIWTDTS